MADSDRKSVYPDMMLLPPPEEYCQECAREHDPEMPHDKQSLYYQMKFQIEKGRGATWTDAMAHCSQEVKDIWTEELLKLGEDVPIDYGNAQSNTDESEA